LSHAVWPVSNRNGHKGSTCETRHTAADAQLTAELEQYSDELVKAYPPIAEDLNKLKEAINVYIAFRRNRGLAGRQRTQ
jgi:hypothetical protein